MNDSLLSTSSGPQETPVPEELLRNVLDATGLDFSGYSRPSLARRLEARMRQIGMADLRAYAAYCAGAPEEYEGLAQTILIHVTAFFRDPWVWEAVESEIVPRLLAHSRKPVQVWCAGCASGEEAFTLAMILAQAVGTESLAQRVSLLATDVSAPKIEHARRGLYDDAKIAEVPPRLRDAYFTRTPEGWAVSPVLRDAVRFECHDLTRDPPPRRLDLISCRNTLMYFDRPLQIRVLTGMARTLRPGGFLLLGRAEGIPPGITALTPQDLTRRLYTRRPQDGRLAPKEA